MKRSREEMEKPSYEFVRTEWLQWKLIPDEEDSIAMIDEDGLVEDHQTIDDHYVIISAGRNIYRYKCIEDGEVVYKQGYRKIITKPYTSADHDLHSDRCEIIKYKGMEIHVLGLSFQRPILDRIVNILGGGGKSILDLQEFQDI